MTQQWAFLKKRKKNELNCKTYKPIEKKNEKSMEQGKNVGQLNSG